MNYQLHYYYYYYDDMVLNLNDAAPFGQLHSMPLLLNLILGHDFHSHWSPIQLQMFPFPLPVLALPREPQLTCCLTKSERTFIEFEQQARNFTESLSQ